MTHINGLGASVLVAGLYSASLLLHRETLLLVASITAIAFPFMVLSFGTDQRKPSPKSVRATKVLSVLLVLGLSLVELLFKDEAKVKHTVQLMTCLIISNLALHFTGSKAAGKIKNKPASNLIENEEDKPSKMINEKPVDLVPTSQTRSIQVQIPVPTAPAISAATAVPAIQSNQTSFTIVPSEHSTGKEVADLGDGNGSPLTDEQLQMCRTLRKKVLDQCLGGFHSSNCEGEMLEFLDLETCRRFLVARGWSLPKAFAQLEQTVENRMKQQPWKWAFKNSPQCVNNPYAMNMRIVGLDSRQRPVVYTSFSHGNDRFHVENGVMHLEMVTEEARRIINRLFRSDQTKAADQMQWIWVIDFAGFSLRDSNPKTAFYAAKMMANFPEMLNQAILIEAPHLFSGVYNVINPVLDDRVRSKIAFVSLKQLKAKTEQRIGSEMADWIVKEAESVRAHKSSMGKREYWTVQPNGHDPRGLSSYVSGQFYVITPGDAWKQRKLADDSGK